MKIYRVGELVYVSMGYDNGHAIGGYGPIVQMVDLITGELYQEKEVITGWGDKNTKVSIGVEVIWKGDSPWGWDDMKEADPKILHFNPHDVNKVDYNKMKSTYSKMLAKMDKKMEILKRYSLTRDDKIKLLIE